MNYRQLIFLLSIFLLLAVVVSCDKGIEPGEEMGPAGFSGKVTFKGSWPEGITRTHLVVFRNPILRSEDFFLPNLSFVSEEIPFSATEFVYSYNDADLNTLLKIGTGDYSYVVVAQSKTVALSLLRKDWTVVGVYCINGNQSSPAKLSVEPGKITSNVDVVVDFNNPPPQPPQ